MISNITPPGMAATRLTIIATPRNPINNSLTGLQKIAITPSIKIRNPITNTSPASFV